MNKLNEYRKAILAALLAFLTVVSTSLDHDGITAKEWVSAAIAAVVALMAVWAVPNAPPTNDGPDDGGYGLIEVLLAIFIILVIVIVLFKLVGDN